MCAGAVVSLLTVWRPFRRLVARVVPIDPENPVHALAISLTVLLATSQLGNQLSQDVLQEVAVGARLQPFDLVVQDIPFVLGAVVGVGLLIRRGGRETLERLGLVRPAVWQVCLGLAAAGLFYAISAGADALATRLTPDLAQQVGAATKQLFGQLDNPVGIATIALTAGIAEEALFRGALQPRLGIPWVAVVFALTHTQYGLSVSVVAVFVLALGLGVLRRIANTTTTMICHTAYNAAVGISIAGVLLPPAIAVEAALIALTATTFAWTRRHHTTA
jgi:membrane protease YdiL (CAAX protease family)